MVRTMGLALVAILFFGGEALTEPVAVSPQLSITRLTPHVYVHTCEHSNGMVFTSDGQAVVVSTPPSDQATEDLVTWTRETLGAEIVAYVIDRWHPDAMEGLDVVHRLGLPSVASERTRRIAKEKGLPVPQRGFDASYTIEVGTQKLVCHFLGEAHTSDGIVVWVPSERVLFGGNGVRNKNGWVGNVADANLGAWAQTIRRIRKHYGDAKHVIPGHGKPGGSDLLDYTERLYTPSAWGTLLRRHDVVPKDVFEGRGRMFEIADVEKTVEERRILSGATLFLRSSDTYHRIDAPQLAIDMEGLRVRAKRGRLRKYTSDHTLVNDMFFEGLEARLRDDAVGVTIVVKSPLR